jgi:hypothetical protein
LGGGRSNERSNSSTASTPGASMMAPGTTLHLGLSGIAANLSLVLDDSSGAKLASSDQPARARRTSSSPPNSVYYVKVAGDLGAEDSYRLDASGE